MNFFVYELLRRDRFKDHPVSLGLFVTRGDAELARDAIITDESNRHGVYRNLIEIVERIVYSSDHPSAIDDEARELTDGQ